MKLHLVRHPQPAIAPGLCYGASDIAVAQAELVRVCAALRGAGLPGHMPVYSSPLQRCARLAQRLQPSGVRFDSRLAEMNFGSWEMLPWSAISRREIDAWAADPLSYRPGGAENVLDVARRVAAFAAELREELAGGGGAEALLVCHAGTMRLLCAMQGGAPLEQAALRATATPHDIGYGETILLKD